MKEFFEALCIIDANLNVWKLLVRLVVASVAGFILGVESRSRSKDFGIKTNTILCLTSCLLMIVSKYGFYEVAKFSGVDYDASRVASTIISGLCFLGAGMMIYRQNSVRGLTTAVGLCLTVAIGMCFGAGMIITGGFVTIFTLFLQIILHYGKGIFQTNKRLVIKAQFTLENNYVKKFKDIFGIKHFITFKVLKRDGVPVAEVEFYYEIKVSSEELVEIAMKEKQILMLEKF